MSGTVLAGIIDHMSLNSGGKRSWAVIRDHHAPLSVIDLAGRAGDGRRLAWPPDVIEMLCASCVPERGEQGWQHERSCPMRSRPL